MHGGGIGGGRKSNFSSRVGGIVLNTAISTVTRVAPLVPTIAPAVPLIIPIYASYKIISFGKRIYDSCDKNDFWKVFKEISEEALKQKVLQQEEALFNEKVSSISYQIRVAAETSQIIKNIATETKTDERVYGDMLEGSIQNGIMSGIKTITSFAIGGILNG